MKVRMAMTMAAALALSACNSSDPTPAPKAQAPETGAAAEVAKLDPDARNGVLERAIKASGAICPSVKSSERTEVRPAATGWRAHCDNDSAHLIEILPDGTAKVTSRTS